MNESRLRELTPAAIGVLVRRGVDFATAEDAVQEALIQATLTWPDEQPDEPLGWLITVAWRKFLDAHRAETSRRDREDRVVLEPTPGPGASADDTLHLFFLCAHPSLTATSAVALTLRAVGGLTTRQIAQAYLVPEATMAQRISRAKRTLADVRFDEAGDLATVLRVLYLVFNEGYTGDVDLAAEAIRLTRQLAERTEGEEVAGLLALMLLHHARRPARLRPDGQLVPLPEQDRDRWDAGLIGEGVEVLQAALARDRLGEFQAQAAIAALHADAASAEETDWPQIVGWYDELLRLTGSPVVSLNRAVAVGEADGALAGLAALATVDPGLPRHAAVDAGRDIATDPSVGPTAINTPRPDVPESRPEIGTFAADVEAVMGGSRQPGAVTSGTAIFDDGAISLVSFDYQLSTQVTLDIRAGVSREVLGWKFAEDTSTYPVGDAMGERGIFGGARQAYIFDQPDGDVVMVVVEGPLDATGPSAEQINALLTGLDVPDSTMTPAEVWQDTMLSMGLDSLHRGDLTVGTPEMYTALPSVVATAYQGKQKTGQIGWQGQILTPETPACPAGFENCGTVQIEGETFLTKYVATGARAGWLYLERDHGDVRAQVILQPYRDGWSLPLEAVAELLLDDRWNSLDPESSVSYPAP